MPKSNRLTSICFRIAFMIALVGCGSLYVSAQWVSQTSHTKARLRGLSAVNSMVAWASGTGGTVLRTTDGGRNWVKRSVPDADKLDFRDIEAFDVNTAYVLSIGDGENSRIYKTTDGGNTWVLQFKNNNPKAFFDALAFWDRQAGLAMSDPVDGRFVIIRTTDGGKNWKQMPPAGLPPAIEGEGAFAASGTCITVNRYGAWFVTGGAAARVFRSTDRGLTWHVSSTPIISGEAASGIFSAAFYDGLNGIAVGGDYKKEKEVGRNAARTTDGGRTWIQVARQPSGYRSAVAYVPDGRGRWLVSVGPSGTDCSSDGGLNWVSMGTSGYDSVSFARTGTAGWASGEGGRIGRFSSKSCGKTESK